VIPAEARERFAAARVATLATVDSSGAPHLVPVTFVVDGDTVWTAVDGKPKRAVWLRRHENVRSHPAVSLLVQHWDEDWSRLWWVRAGGTARVTEDPSTVERAVARLRRKYEQYQTVGVGGPVIEVAVQTWRGWAARE
jgi:PPOX class probable F420-dependent enzyme